MRAVRPQAELPISFALLLNLVSASNAHDKDVLWGFIRRYAPDATPEEHPVLDQLVGYAVAYFDDFVKPAKKFRAATDKERAAMTDALRAAGRAAARAPTARRSRTSSTRSARRMSFEPLRDWFQALYEVLLGQSQGPRFGVVRRALRHRGDAGADRADAGAGGEEGAGEESGG